jgi:sugar/nucleoside kinase (ribokinase family)
VDSQGRRFSFYDGRHPADLLIPWEFCAPYVARADHVYVSRSHFNRDLFDRVREREISTVTDLHAWDGKDTSAHPWAYGADIVFMSAATVGGEVQDVLRNIISNGRAELAVATDGANGCFVLERGSTTVRHFAAVQPDRPVVDSNGAGDAFLTAFLHTRFDGGTIEACVLAGSISGAFACSHHGTHEVQITAQQLEERAHRLQAPTL